MRSTFVFVLLAATAPPEHTITNTVPSAMLAAGLAAEAQ